MNYRSKQKTDYKQSDTSANGKGTKIEEEEKGRRRMKHKKMCHELLQNTCNGNSHYVSQTHTNKFE